MVEALLLLRQDRSGELFLASAIEREAPIPFVAQRTRLRVEDVRLGTDTQTAVGAFYDRIDSRRWLLVCLNRFLELSYSSSKLLGLTD